MRASVVFESMFGNTEQLADTICEGLRDQGVEVTRCRVGDAGDHELAQDLLVLGAPTHTFTLSRPATRAEAVTKGAAAVGATTGVRDWLDALDPTSSSAGVAPEVPGAVAVFDTRATTVRHLPGSAAKSTARILRKRGLDVGEVTSFFVDDVRGPLVEGELSRARSWGRHLAVTTR